jgi:hypothetical protein
MSGVTRSRSIAPHVLTVHNLAYSGRSSDEARSNRGPAADGLYVVSIVVEVFVSRFSLQFSVVLAFVLFIADAVAIGQLADGCSTLASFGFVTVMCLCVVALVVCTNALDSRSSGEDGDGWGDDDRPSGPGGPGWWPEFERDFRAYCGRERVR